MERPYGEDYLQGLGEDAAEEEEELMLEGRVSYSRKLLPMRYASAVSMLSLWRGAGAWRSTLIGASLH